MVSLGRINITSSGTPQPISTSNQPNTRGKIRVQADPANTGFIYVGLKNMVTATRVGMLGVVGKPPTTGEVPYLDIEVPLAPGGVSVNQLYIDGTTNEGAIVSIY